MCPEAICLEALSLTSHHTFILWFQSQRCVHAHVINHRLSPMLPPCRAAYSCSSVSSAAHHPTRQQPFRSRQRASHQRQQSSSSTSSQQPMKPNPDRARARSLNAPHYHHHIAHCKSTSAQDHSAETHHGKRASNHAAPRVRSRASPHAVSAAGRNRPRFLQPTAQPHSCCRWKEGAVDRVEHRSPQRRVREAHLIHRDGELLGEGRREDRRVV